MTELADLLPTSTDLGFRRARVIAVKSNSLTVDLGGGIDIACADGCNPLPNQWVWIAVQGSSMLAVAAIGGVYRQATITITAAATNTVTGLVNGVSMVVPKMGAFTPTVGAVLPLIWSADGSGVWAGSTPGTAYVPPPDGGGGTGGGGTVTTGTATYAATYSGSYLSTGWLSGYLGGGSPSAFFYGASRFRELQGRTILRARVNLTRFLGSGTVVVYGNPQAGPGGAPSLAYNGGTVNPTGWVSIPLGLANYMIAGSGTASLAFNFSGLSLNGIPSGTVQFDWQK